jgi:hypothetical protein
LNKYVPYGRTVNKVPVVLQGRAVQPAGWRDNLTTGGHTVILQYHTEFEGGGADETFAIRLDGDNGQLAGYHINSMAMMVK